MKLSSPSVTAVLLGEFLALLLKRSETDTLFRAHLSTVMLPITYIKAPLDQIRLEINLPKIYYEF